VEAYARSYASDLNFNYSKEGNDPCPTANTTHVVTVAGIGGLTRDGVNNFAQNQFSLFKITMTNGTALPLDRYVQLADIDGDDLTDICLRLLPGEFEDLGVLDMQCNMSDPEERFSLPKGIKNGLFPCTETQPQQINHITCPQSVLCR